MANMSDFLENALLDHALGTAAMTMPADVYAAFHTANAATVGEDGVGSESVQTTTDGRVLCGAFSAAVGGVADNDANITILDVAATETFVSVSLWTTAAHGTGDCLFVGNLTAPVALTIGDDFQLDAGDLVVTFT